MTFPIRVPALALACSAMAAGGCASRSASPSYPANAALSPQAPEAPSAHVTVALQHEPPLPGERNAGWPGLEQASGDAPHNEHAGHDHSRMEHAPVQAGHDHAHMQHSAHGHAQDGGADAAP
jgi:hypothetical protein